MDICLCCVVYILWSKFMPIQPLKVSILTYLGNYEYYILLFYFYAHNNHTYITVSCHVL
jgi:hypothetical protein